MSNNDFDGLVPFYDILKKTVFGNRLDRASGFFLNRIRHNERVLVLGPGSGEVLEDIFAIEVIALEKSNRFIEKAKLKNPNVEFIHEDFLQWDNTKSFDWVICPFFLDVFALPELREVIRKIINLLQPTGKLVVSDFQVSRNIRHEFLQRLMHLFFRWAARLDADHLEDIHNELSVHFKRLELEEFGEDVFSGVYKKRLQKEP